MRVRSKGDCAEVLRMVEDPKSLTGIPASARAALRQMLLKKPSWHSLSSWTYLTQLHGDSKVRQSRQVCGRCS